MQISAPLLFCSFLFAAPPSADAEADKPKAPAVAKAKVSPAKTKGKAKTKTKASPAKTKKPAASAKKREPILAKIQALYDGTQDFQANFVQIYTRVALSQTFEQRGVLRFKKPGMVRFDYKEPAEKYFVADGKQLWTYEPEDAEVIVQRNFKADRLNSSIGFLWGQPVEDSFEAKVGPTEKGLVKIELTPKHDPNFVKLILTVEAKTGRVLDTVLYETAGNTNEFRFTDLKFNTGLKDSMFQFQPPPGVDVTEVP